MVLLTSSAVSAALSAGVVCTFTFLLFLSGYVLQQQTVKSLQEAIRNPPEKPWYPKPTLSPQILREREKARLENDRERVVQTNADQQVLGSESQKVLLETKDSPAAEQQQDDEPSPLQLWHDYVSKSRSQDGLEGLSEDTTNSEDETIEDELPHDVSGRHAYILTIPNTTDLCSVVLFTQWHRSISKLTPKPSIVYVYPASWELSDSPIHTGAMTLIRQMQDTHDIVCHPVSISRIWAGVSVETQLLADLQRTRWTYDRAMYFRSPGIVLDITAVDRALTLSSVKRSWQGLSPKSTTLTPSLLLYVHENGLLAPRAEMRKLTAQAQTTHALRHADEMAVEAKHAAYVIFDEKDLQHRRQEQILSTGIFERFERERRNACAGTAILSRFDADNAEQ